MLENGEPYYLHWPAKDYGPCVVGVNVDIPRKLLAEHVEQLTEAQKELEIVVDNVPPLRRTRRDEEEARMAIDKATSEFTSSVLGGGAQSQWMKANFDNE